MFSRVKNNKGYYTLLLSDTSYGTVMIGLTLSLLNPALGLAVAGLNFVGNIAAGLAMAPKDIAPDASETPPAEAAAPPAPKLPLKTRSKKVAGRILKYFKSTYKDPDFVVGFTAAEAGANILFQAVAGIHSILTAHSILFFSGLTGAAAVGGVAAGAAVAGMALFCIAAGNVEKWKGISKHYTRIFHKGAAAEAEGTRSGLSQWVEKHPLLNGIANSRVARGIKKAVIVGVAAESSLFTVVASSSVLVRSIVTMATAPHRALSQIVPMLLAVRWGAGPAWSLISAGRVTVNGLLHRKHKGQEAAAAVAAVQKPPEAEPQPAPALAGQEALTGAFNAEAPKAVVKKTPAGKLASKKPVSQKKLVA